MAKLQNDETSRTRRRLLGGMVSATGISAAALLGINTPAAAAPPPPQDRALEELFSLARLRSYSSRRSSSWDRTGGNADAVPVDPGHSATVLDVTGAGVVTHIWFTISSPDRLHLKNLVLRAWWDGESSPSVEVPIGDFFGLGLGEYFTYQSALLAVANVKALNSYFQMPFSSAARITVTNDGPDRVHSLYYAVDYISLPAIPADLGRFHAQYRQATPCNAVTGNGKNLDGRDNYVFLEATGRGHVIGVTQSVLQNQNGWFGEGDDMIFIDGSTQPVINGTGTEDFYNGAWDFGLEPFANMHQGAPYVVDPERIGGRYSMYRWFLEGPLAFEKSIRVTIEHGAANNRSDNFFSTAYWYQAEPHAPFPPLPAPAERVPRVFAVNGDNAVAPLNAG
ncbi:MAG TPA: glycoside hydrolase family 172 protein [Terracidiphilus sp.]|nr:glycoside hydrolase family 172 protein [Terracidiphilus sp.]